MPKQRHSSITGPALRFARIRAGLPQVGLARRLGHPTPATVAEWERGKRAIPRTAYTAIGAAILAARMEQARCEQTR